MSRTKPTISSKSAKPSTAVPSSAEATPDPEGHTRFGEDEHPTSKSKAKTFTKEQPLSPTNPIAAQTAPQAEEPVTFACVLVRDPATGRPKASCGPQLTQAEARALILAEEAEAGRKVANARPDDDADSVEAARNGDAQDDVEENAVEADGVENDGDEDPADTGLDGEADVEEVEPPLAPPVTEGRAAGGVRIVDWRGE